MKNQTPEVNSKQETQELPSPCTETANMSVQGHLLIKDADTNEILVNQRG